MENIICRYFFLFFWPTHLIAEDINILLLTFHGRVTANSHRLQTLQITTYTSMLAVLKLTMSTYSFLAAILHKSSQSYSLFEKQTFRINMYLRRSCVLKFVGRERFLDDDRTVNFRTQIPVMFESENTHIQL